MVRCPHCETTASPWRLLLVTRRWKYRCTCCGGHSTIDLGDQVMFGAVGGIIGGALLPFMSSLSYAAMLQVDLLLLVVIWLVSWNLGRPRLIDEEEE